MIITQYITHSGDHSNDLKNRSVMRKPVTGVTHWQREGEVAFSSFSSTYGHICVSKNPSQHRQKVNSLRSDNIMRQDSHSSSVKQCLKV